MDETAELPTFDL